MRIRKTVASTRGLIFFLFTSRYTLHVLLTAFALPLAFSQLRPAAANADVGQHSILYALVTNGQGSVTQETSSNAPTNIPSYINEVARAQTGIDFDYGTAIDTDPTTDRGLAGTIALRSQPDNAFPNAIPIGEDVPAFATTEIPATPAETRTGIVEYTIKSGDAIASIARRYGITTQTILWANNLTATSRIQPGDTLKILPTSGVLYTVKRGDTFAAIAKTYGVDTNALRDANSANAKLAIGSEIVVPNGKPPVAIAVKKPAAIVSTTRTPSKATIRPDVPIAAIKGKAFDVYQELASSNEDTREKPEDEVVEKVTKTTFVWPTASRAINQYYGWNHTGVDINGDYTDPIYASADGTVAEAGWNSGGYGLQVVINHDNGYKTRYAHASKLFVKAGEEVKQGQVIGYVGTTGRSTGTHLHYEIYKNGKRGNPLTYVK